MLFDPGLCVAWVFHLVASNPLPFCCLPRLPRLPLLSFSLSFLFPPTRLSHLLHLLSVKPPTSSARTEIEECEILSKVRQGGFSQLQKVEREFNICVQENTLSQTHPHPLCVSVQAQNMLNAIPFCINILKTIFSENFEKCFVFTWQTKGDPDCFIVKRRSNTQQGNFKVTTRNF